MLWNDGDQSGHLPGFLLRPHGGPSPLFTLLLNLPQVKTGTIGFPSDHQEVAVMDEEGRVVQAGVEGELVTRLC